MGASSPSVGSGKRRASGGVMAVNHNAIDKEVSKLKAYLWEPGAF